MLAARSEQFTIESLKEEQIPRGKVPVRIAKPGEFTPMEFTREEMEKAREETMEEVKAHARKMGYPSFKSPEPGTPEPKA